MAKRGTSPPLMDDQQPIVGERAERAVIGASADLVVLGHGRHGWQHVP
jgi:hypothetical protein